MRTEVDATTTGEGRREKGETHGGAALRAAVVVKDPGYKQQKESMRCLYPGSFTTT
jgi:hypothetical protein